MATKAKRKQVRTITIDRAKWGRSRLLNIEGKMCCLGFAGKACGISDKVMSPWGFLSGKASMEKTVKSCGLGWLFEYPDGGASFETQLVHINDGSSPKREEKITKIFADHGVKVKFVDKPLKKRSK